MRLEHRFGIFKVCVRFHHGLGARFGIAGLENARPDKHRLGAQLAHQRGVRGGRDSARRKIRHRQFPGLRDLPNELERRAQFLCFMHQLIVAHRGEFLHLAHDRAHMPHSFHHVAGTRFALGANHRRTFADAPQRLAQIARAAHERHAVIVLPNMVFFIGRRQHFALIDEVHFQRLQNFRFREVSDAHLGHHRNCHGGHDFANHFDRRHPRHAAFFADVRRHALQGHHRARSGVFRDLRLFGVRNVHDHAAFEHLRQAHFHAPFV